MNQNMKRFELPHHGSYNAASGTTEACPENGWHEAPTWLNMKTIFHTQMLEGVDACRHEIASWLGVIPDNVEISIIAPSI